ncbi:hypothetical protein GC105_07555 [Alkalibaculum sp. M08DMB]|uniref:Uroporphyrinogen decarboxylase (URO-D) domain-containing protein n=1 Tax=Alkalibaculum sporogenes TaxID=2655001 RepID=A0A6A7K954_9FIRM|nr:uroporphyrinogen decarboxylase family protein [Alkalibaculum sporogenes]MPW25643.1 hypothetical protein [Alkalibaculum sporogenes]
MVTKERDIIQCVLEHKCPPRFPVNGIQLDFVPWEHSHEPQGGYDWFGVHWTKEKDGTQVVTQGFKRLNDISEWKEKDIMPKLNLYDWEEHAKSVTSVWDRENYFQMIKVQSGHFERLYSIVGFEDALISFYESEEDVMEFFEALTQTKLEIINRVKKYYNPDVYSQHDDWGTNLNMFFKPDMWRKFIKPHVMRLVDECHKLGMYYEQHTCGHVTPVIQDLVEIGVDMVEIQSCNDLEYIKENFGDKLILRGCFNGQIISRPDVGVEEARKSVRYTMEVCGKNGGFLPSVVWGIKDPLVLEAVKDEMSKCEMELCIGSI